MEAFILEETKEVEELGCRAERYRHIKTGARVLKLAAPHDDHKVFCIAFRTPPADDTGCAHIIEHSVLCGSRRYRTKEPFLDLLKGSLATFLNAFTYASHTLYPVASRNARDFAILTDVYLDAVFHPRVVDDLPQAFLQEGWHLHDISGDVDEKEKDDENKDKEESQEKDESESESDEEEESYEGFEYKGVVYNEMRGAYSDPEAVLASAVQTALFPDTAYRHDSGGVPAAIPTLSYADFVARYRRCYHPSNSCTVLYGDGDTATELAHLDRYFAEYAPADCPLPDVALQAPFDAPVTVQRTYPVVAATESSSEGKGSKNSKEEEENRWYYSVSWQVGQAAATSAEDAALFLVVLPVLDWLLVRREGAVLKEAVLKAGLARSVTSHLELDVKQPYYTVTAAHARADSLAAFVALVEDVLRTVARTGFDSAAVAACTNRVEFALREGAAGADGDPPGLAHAVNALRAWLWGGSPLAHVAWAAPLAFARDAADAFPGGPGMYYAHAAEHFLLTNPHRAAVSLAPDAGLAAQQRAEARARLEGAVRALGAKGTERCRAENAKLRAWQRTPDSEEARATIPALSLADVRACATPYPAIVKEPVVVAPGGASVPVLCHETAAAHGVLYLDVLFDAARARLQEEDVFACGLLAGVLGRLPTSSHSYEDLATMIDGNTGGISLSAWPLALRRSDDGDDDATGGKQTKPLEYKPYMRLHVRLLAERLEAVPGLLREVLRETRFDDGARLHELLREAKARADRRLQGAPHRLVLPHLEGLSTPAAAFTDRVAGLAHTRRLAATLAHWDPAALAARLAALARRLLAASCATVVLTSDAHGLELAQKPAFLNGCVQALGVDPRGDAPVLEPSVDEGKPSFFELQQQQEQQQDQQEQQRAPIKRAYVTSTTVNYIGLAQNFVVCAGRREADGALLVATRVVEFEWLWDRVRVRGGAYGAFIRAQRSGALSLLSYRDPGVRATLDVYRAVPRFLAERAPPEAAHTRAVIGLVGELDAPRPPASAGLEAAARALSGFDDAWHQRRWAQVLACTPADVRAQAPLFQAVLDRADTVAVLGPAALDANRDLFDQVLPLIE